MHVSGALHLAVCLSLIGGLLPARTIICVQPHPGPLVKDEDQRGQGCPQAPAERLLLDPQAVLRPKGCFPGLHSSDKKLGWDCTKWEWGLQAALLCRNSPHPCVCAPALGEVTEHGVPSCEVADAALLYGFIKPA